MEEFVLLAIDKLTKAPYKGMHVVFTGFNDAFREAFPGKDPREELDKLADKGVIRIRPAKGGAVIYRVDSPYRTHPSSIRRAREVLKEMGLES